MQKSLVLVLGCATSCAAVAQAALVSGEQIKWHTITLDFESTEFYCEDSNQPNPFMDRRLTVRFGGPDGQVYTVPGFFDGDGNGGDCGSVWRARFAPDQAGTWTYHAELVAGTDIAVNLEQIGSPMTLDGATGSFEVAPRDQTAPGFLKYGQLEYVGEHYLKFRDGRYFIKGGADSPENLLSYCGMDDMDKKTNFGVVHQFAAHIEDYNPEDPYFEGNSDYCGPGVWDSRGLIGALNYLSGRHVNSIYFLPMNMGGDGYDVTPYVGYNKNTFNKTHFDLSRMRQWNIVFEHAKRKGILLHFVLQETEEGNEDWLDGGVLGRERKLYFRELVARFSHHLAIKWNMGEEWDTGTNSIADLTARAEYMQQLDPYNHPMAVHHRTHEYDIYYPLIVGDPLFSATSFQFDAHKSSDLVEHWRAESTAQGNPWVLDMDEVSGGVHDQTIQGQDNSSSIRKQALYDIYFSGGNIEWYGGNLQQDDVALEDFSTRENMWNYTWYARNFMEVNLPFWEMQPADHLVTGESEGYGDAEVFAKEGEVYAIYYSNTADPGSLSLPAGQYEQTWYSPITGQFDCTVRELSGGGVVDLGQAPHSGGKDWVTLVRRSDRLTLGAPCPGEPEQLNTLQVRNAEPNSVIVLLWSLQLGETPIPICPGQNADIEQWGHLATLMTDDNGEATYSTFVSGGPNTVGAVVYMQAVDPYNCEVSNLSSYIW